MAESFRFYNESALLDRLSNGLKRRAQEVVFLVGAPLSAPVKPGMPGVPGVDGVLELIRSEFLNDPNQLVGFDREISGATDKKYQAAFEFLQGHRGPQISNEVVQRAVLAARTPGTTLSYTSSNGPRGSEETWLLMDEDVAGWTLTPATDALGRLIANYPHRFGRSLLTTNFDPLIEVAVTRANGIYYRTTLHADGNISQTYGPGCHIIHLHGYWHGSDTLHTARQLGQLRPQLKASLGSLLRNKLVVVSAYSGWDDVFTDALMEVVRDDTAFPEIIWTFYSPSPALSDGLAERLRPGIDRGRVNLYSGIDCNALFPSLYQVWSRLETPAPLSHLSQSNPVRISDALRHEVEAQKRPQIILEGDEADRPPFVEICVGRDEELRRIIDFDGNVVFVTGIGGQGKSTLAAEYFDSYQDEHAFSLRVWRDCKEESERFENQLAFVIERLTQGKFSGAELAKQPAGEIIDILVNLLKRLRVLFVFDNADHYVNLETARMTGSPHLFIEALLRPGLNSRAVFTCRPGVTYDDPRVLSCHLEGLSMEATLGLFAKRGAASNRTDIENAHTLTEGHAFWLDLLAVQVARRTTTIDLASLVQEIRSGRGPLPENTLNSIWRTLHDRERIVLRAMAESVKPDSVLEISEYLRHQLTYQKTVKALNALRALNLIVVKRQPNTPDVLELHPLVRQFIIRLFTRREQISFINGIVKVYRHFIGKHKAQLGERTTLSFLQYWTQSAELSIAAAKYRDAFLTLEEASNAFMASAYPREFSRTARHLLSSVDWIRQHDAFKGFEKVFSTHLDNLALLGEHGEVDQLLSMYEQTVLGKDSRYIQYCDLRCYSLWLRGDFNAAVEWGKKGKHLKDSSNVDTVYDVEHSLALAERDAGRPEAALEYFLEEEQLSNIIDPEELDDDMSGDYYGNIGRCLQFMGQNDSALVCFQKSAILIEKHPGKWHHVVNQGYIRMWIGQLLVTRQEFWLAAVFFRAAYLKWEQASPPKAERVLQLSKEISDRVRDSQHVDDGDIEKICLDWVLGRHVSAARA